ncbi:efflux RND transporter periplasmic adaptor subunit [Sphingobacterium sp. FBM7-1]|uniref:efflux RND transporter periplasmic adaptor subunit n=1 Tax=Sphingobacterium sp. FBM7-1 TaxID=2886688 RepID=UPI001D105467|nr:efflux RND transporter periplasmic adaptor subunit [Sphingobacterium sp. FBM7-1]MCC2600026.1 efflux RND transporter periplasmic adaptor subunit [Sphingobacterium sp. FBM7-1]
MTKRFATVFIVIVLIIAGLVTYRLIENSEKDAENALSQRRVDSKIYGMVVTGKPFSDFLSLSGSIEPNEVIGLRSEISGIVEELNFSEGGNVSKGQLLIKINDAELKAQLAQAKTANSLAEENERRAKLLLEKEAISQEEYDIASADYRTTESQIQLIAAQLTKTAIRAPFSGTIGLRNISQGSYITPTTDIAQLVDVSKVKLEFAIPERYAAEVKNGISVRFTVQGTNAAFTAKIYAVEPLVETATRTLRVRALADNRDSRLIPGTFANVIFPLGTIENGLLVPAEALIPIQNGKKIFIKKDGVAKEILVETGARTDADVLVSKGLNEGDTVLTSGVMSLRDGSPVHVTLR